MNEQEQKTPVEHLTFTEIEKELHNVFGGTGDLKPLGRCIRDTLVRHAATLSVSGVYSTGTGTEPEGFMATVSCKDVQYGFYSEKDAQDAALRAYLLFHRIEVQNA